MRDYGKVHTSFWSSDDTHNLSDDAKLLAIYLLTGQHTNMIGCFRLPDGYVTEDLNWPLERVLKGFGELSKNGFATRDSSSKWVVIHKFLSWNTLDNPNQGISALRLFGQVPDKSNLKPQLARVLLRAIGHLDHSKLKGSERVLEPFRNQEQDQEEEQEKKTNTSDSNRTADENASQGQEPPAPENPDSESGELAGGAGKADPVETAFEEIFWGAGLRKDAKVKAKNAFRTKFTAWKKTTRGSADEFAQMLADDIRLRVQAKTFGFDKLLPTSYLNGERWNDEKPQVAAQSGAAGARPLVQQGANQVFVDYDALRAGGR